MLVHELIQMLCDNPSGLIEELNTRRTALCQEHEKLEKSITKLNQVMRIAIDVRARNIRNEREISELHDALEHVAKHSDGERLDLSNLYILGDDDLPESESAY
tara:strand:+ start:99 stop:407 length:309 start_codon:yes stop_codon:yes gene_type:complete